ncbi:cytochrome c [Stieleria sp. JC731]|uniref:c-type cytochrome n=1 Tax=Pirellulaceae TaxID=2691357 RepID=UPI001E6071FA|nr:cytochrome c [Stieleria sp. JC731]MCC9599099.1 cytochrome c [Stieleria sp. JC731]
MSALSASAGSITESVDYENDVAPIIAQNCSGCHQPNQSGPFPLLTFEDVATHAETIEAVIADGYMPPWKPVDTGIKFVNERCINDHDRKIISTWIAAGKPRGERPQPPQATLGDIAEQPEPTDWLLGQPDLVVSMKTPFEIPAEGPDLYRSFVFEVGLTKDRWIKAMEIRPSARGAMHHALFFVDPSGKLRQRHASDGRTGFNGMSFLSAAWAGAGGITENFNRGLGGYVPGAIPTRLPGDLARKLPAGSDIVMQTHFHPIGRTETEQATLAIYFADKAPSHELIPLQLPPLFGIGAGIDVPAGEANFVVRHSYTLPIDVSAIEVGGHAHYICSSMQLDATLPGGSMLTLLKIEDWDLDWQDSYQFADAIDLPTGTRLDVRITYDNSAANPSNPFTPPRQIAWGRESTDEMGSMILNVVAKDESERDVLIKDIQQNTKDALRRRILAQQQKLGISLPTRMPNMRLLMLLDQNGDQKIQSSEVPERFRSRLFDFFDNDQDATLDETEIRRLRTFISELMSDEE